MKSLTNHLLVIACFAFFSTLLIWLPHYLAPKDFLGLNFQNGFATIYRNYDGLEYVVIAKSFYYPDLIGQLPLTQPANYYAAHFPGYSLAMIPIASIIGFLKSMLFVSLLFTILSSLAFYYLVRDFKLSSNPLLLTLIFLILPARWLIVRSVGSAEPVFAFFVITSIYFFLKAPRTSFIWLSAILASLAQLTRPPGILLAIALGVYVLWQTYHKKSLKYLLSYYPFLLIPLTLLAIFYWFSISYQDFFAYFHSGDNIHLFFPPFQSLNKNQFWVGSMWLEDIIYIFILGFLAGMLLIKQKLYPLAFFVLTYLLASIFVAHRDISRYTLPIVPFALIAFEKILVSKEFRIVLIIIAFAIYLYSQNFILENTAPIPNLAPYN